MARRDTPGGRTRELFGCYGRYYKGLYSCNRLTRASAMDFSVYARAVGANVRKARLLRGLTQEQVAARGFTYRFFQELERGVRNPSLRMLYDLATALDVTVADLVDVGEAKLDPPLRLADPPRIPPGRKSKAARSRR
jgi:DNA-binding XRE family transcriptional regulator